MPEGAGLHDHRIALFIECRNVDAGEVARMPDIGFRDLARQRGAPPWIDPTRLERNSERNLLARNVWEWAPFNLSHDLEPAVAIILAGTPSPAITAEPGFLHVTEFGRHLIAGRYRQSAAGGGAQHPQRLLLQLGPVSLRRLGRDPTLALELRVEEIALIPFATGLAILLVEAKLVLTAGGALDARLLSEAVHVLADERPPRPPCLAWSPLPGEPTSQFRLSDLLQPFMGERTIELERERRIYSYCSALLEEPVAASEGRDLALRLSRRYNSGYAAKLDGGGTEFYEPFADVLHAASLEGAATVVNGVRTRSGEERAPEFLTNWLGTAYQTAYLPIALVVFHEHLALVDLARQAASMAIDFSQFAGRQAAALRRLCDRFLAVRLRYRPAQVSGITMHNRFGQCLSRALNIEALSRKAAEDAAEAEARLRRYAAERAAAARAAAARREAARERSWAWYGAAISASLAVLAILSLTKEGTDAVHKIPEAFRAIFHGEPPEAAPVGFVIALVVAAIGLVPGLRRAFRREVAEEIEEEAETLHIAAPHREKREDKAAPDGRSDRPSPDPDSRSPA